MIGNRFVKINDDFKNLEKASEAAAGQNQVLLERFAELLNAKKARIRELSAKCEEFPEPRSESWWILVGIAVEGLESQGTLPPPEAQTLSPKEVTKGSVINSSSSPYLRPLAPSKQAIQRPEV